MPKRVVIAFCLLLIVLGVNAALAAWCVDHLPEQRSPSAADFQVLFLTVAAGTSVALGLAALAIYLDWQDRAERHRAAERLHREREWYERSLLGIGDGVIATDEKGQVALMNPVAQHLTGWAHEEAAGKPITEVFRIVNEETRRETGSLVERVLREGTVVGLGNHTVLIARNGTERPIEDSGAPIRGNQGEVLGAILVFRDATPRRRHEAEVRDREARLRETGRQKDEFLAMLAHELRNPLAPLRNAVQLLRLRGEDPDTVTWARELIERQTAHITRMVDDLLDAARMARGTVHLQRQRLDLVDLMRTAVEDHRGSLATAGLTLELDLPREPIGVQGDPTRLAQVIGNLLHNAAKFTDAGGRVLVRVAQAEGFASVTVQDTGMGIDPAMLPRLFEAFTQADRTLERSRGGLGLGLALVKGLVELHGGRVEAFSDGPNQGASFTFWLPIDPEPSATEASRPAPGGPARRFRVLVIEDNRDVADSLRVLLQLLGHEVTVASGGPEGLEQARKVRPEVILCDLDLPGTSAFEVARALRQDPATASVRLIAVSDHGQEEDQRQALAAGFDQALLKPVDPDRLQQMLADLP